MCLVLATSAGWAADTEAEMSLCRVTHMAGWLAQNCPGAVTNADLTKYKAMMIVAKPGKAACDAGTQDISQDIARLSTSGSKLEACTFYKSVFDMNAEAGQGNVLALSEEPASQATGALAVPQKVSPPTAPAATPPAATAATSSPRQPPAPGALPKAVQLPNTTVAPSPKAPPKATSGTWTSGFFAN